MDMCRFRFFLSNYESLFSFLKKIKKNEKILKMKCNLDKEFLSNIMLILITENWYTKENYVCEIIVYITDKERDV